MLIFFKIENRTNKVLIKLFEENVQLLFCRESDFFFHAESYIKFYFTGGIFYFYWGFLVSLYGTKESIDVSNMDPVIDDVALFLSSFCLEKKLDYLCKIGKTKRILCKIYIIFSFFSLFIDLCMYFFFFFFFPFFHLGRTL